jgi:CBS domain containing-hemolysin-like protein
VGGIYHSRFTFTIHKESTVDVDSQWAALLVLAITLFFLVVMRAAETALSTISRSRLQSLIEQGVNGSETALQLIEDFATLQLSLSILNILLVTIATAAGLVAAVLPNQYIPLTVLLIVLATLALQMMGEVVGARWSIRYAPALAPLLKGVVFCLMPVRAILTAIQKRFVSQDQLEEEARRESEEEMRLLASVVGEEETDIADEGREMIYNVLTLSQTTVREVMVPRPDIVALKSQTSMLSALDTIIDAGHSRIPVYDDYIDNIIGVLYAKDLLRYLRDDRSQTPIRDIVRPALFIPTSKRADQLLEDLQRRHVHLAIIFDEYGGTAGIVTIEDILEEIVGEIQDEYDSEEESFVRKNEYEAIVSGRYDIHDLNHEMELDLPTDENDTVGGLIYSTLRGVPLVGDDARIEEAGVTFQVVAMAGHRISKVCVMVDHHESEDDSSPDEVIVKEEERSPIRANNNKMEMAFLQMLMR